MQSVKKTIAKEAKELTTQVPILSGESLYTTSLEHLKNADIIVIEDEPLMAALIHRYLKAEILQALPGWPQNQAPRISTYSSAWELFTADLSGVKIAVVDILLPQVTGVDFIRDLRKRYPNMGIIPVSGMATEPMKRSLRELLPDGQGLVPKPLRREEFMQALGTAWSFYYSGGGKVAPIESVPVENSGAGVADSLWSHSVSQSKPVAVMKRKGVKKAA